ncbi:deoxynucleoside kinase [Lactobacillus xylocopicola]|uniref:Deoxyguanosine kinase n=1 Tax=Lactobacillus xylocopicola TaxID=2976676 RepID=A0ABM8BIU2_9LACO|nr:deoxynucleoside kinase [Lactobacillus xylocopicola]BDR61235.1 deoxyguanosine kinase [Lactobacillus xylocopicola]
MTVIVLSGPIGAGKSSLTKILAKYLGTKPFYESVDNNPVLPLFYADPQKYAFLLQVFFLNTRFRSIKDALTDDNNVLDRSIYEDALFFQMNADIGRATTEEVDTYYELLNNMMGQLEHMPKKNPDLLVHINVSYDTMIKRIQKRGRPYEQLSYDATLEDYYKRLLRYYEPWYEKYDYSPKMEINGDELDFVSNDHDLQLVLDQIVAKLKDLGKLPTSWDKPTNIKISQ